MSELFMYGDQRFLSGGAHRSVEVNYDVSPMTVEDLHVPSAAVTSAVVNPTDVAQSLSAIGQTVHKGKRGYHDRPRLNVFLRRNEWPSVGVELETVMRQCSDSIMSEATEHLKSNWFHFERDGSLDPSHGGRFGLELITEPLPPRAYRQSMLWTGLQNLISPWLKSFDAPETGLHVHVGLNQFETIDEIPVRNPNDRRIIGKTLAALLYYTVVDQAFLDRVVLRKTGSYCALPDCPALTEATGRVTTNRATGAALVDITVRALQRSVGSDRWRNNVEVASTHLASPGYLSNLKWCNAILLSGHHIEINMEHPYTIEFRRAKGTIHGLSIHRIVELMTGIVRYAGKIARTPDMTVTRRSFMEWLAETTTSEALRTLAVDHMKGMK